MAIFKCKICGGTLEINIGEEESKSGFSANEIENALEEITKIEEKIAD
mgnify:CR=1 FL=1